jgi:hypothetical protein
LNMWQGFTKRKRKGAGGIHEEHRREWRYHESMNDVRLRDTLRGFATVGDET